MDTPEKERCYFWIKKELCNAVNLIAQMLREYGFCLTQSLCSTHTLQYVILHSLQ